MMVPCRYGLGVCHLYMEKDGKNIVETSTCELCLKAREIQQVGRVLETVMAMPEELTKALRTLNTYTGRLERTLARLAMKEVTA